MWGGEDAGGDEGLVDDDDDGWLSEMSELPPSI